MGDSMTEAFERIESLRDVVEEVTRQIGEIRTTSDAQKLREQVILQKKDIIGLEEEILDLKRRIALLEARY